MEQPESEINQQVKKIRQVLGGVCVFFITASQVMLFTTPFDSKVIAPRGFWLGLLGVALLILSQLAPIPRRFLRVNLLACPPASLRIAASILFALLTTYAMVNFQRMGRVNYMPVLSLWAISALIYLSTFRMPTFSRGRAVTWLKAHRPEWLTLMLITLLAAALRFYRLGSIPRVINGDEGMIGIIAQSTTFGHLANPFALHQNMGALYLQTLNLFITMLQPSALSIRLPSAIGGVLSVLVSYLLARRIFGTRVALLTAAMIAISHTHINFSRTLTGYVQETWLIPLEVYLLLLGFELRRSWLTALAGMLLALHFSYYLTAPPMAAIILGFMILAFLFHRRWFRSVLPQAAAFWGGLVILLIPSLYQYLKTPAELMARLSMEGTFQSGWLKFEMIQTGKSALQIMLGRLGHAFLSLIYYPSLDFYGSPVPMLSMITSVLFLVGLVFALIKVRQIPVLLSLTVFFGFLAFIAIFAIPPSADSYRVVIILPFAMIFSAIGIDALFEMVGLKWEKSAVQYISLSSILLVFLFLTNMQIYFGDFAGRCLFGGDTVSRFASYLGNYAGKFDPSTPVHLLSDEQYFYGSHPSVDFLSRTHRINNIADPIERLSFPRNEVIIASPDRIHELETWIDLHPGGKAQYFYDCQRTIMLGYQAP